MKTHLDGDQYGNAEMHSGKTLKRGVKTALLMIAVLSVASLGVVARSAHRPRTAQREVQATRTKVAPNAIGRDQAMPGSMANDIEKEQLPVSIKNQDPQAGLEQARAALESAEEHNKRVQAACAEYICAQSNWWVQANVISVRAEHAVARSRALQAAGVISPGELQDLERGLDWARSCERAAKASLDLAVALFGREGDAAASAKLETPTRRVAELEASVASLAITSSIPRVPSPEP